MAISVIFVCKIVDMERSQSYNSIKSILGYCLMGRQGEPSLGELASYLGMSEARVNELFVGWAGVKCEQFRSWLNVKALKQDILVSDNLIKMGEPCKVSSRKSCCDSAVNIESMTTDEYSRLGRLLIITYGFGETPFGRFLVAITPKGICSLQFVDDELEILTQFEQEWGCAVLIRDDSVADEVVENIFARRGVRDINLHLKGTSFQIEVWIALLAIPFGMVVSYGGLARLANKDRGVRAVASAVARNPIGYIVPCHRVIRNEGMVGEYRWGSERKASIIGWERAMVGSRDVENQQIVVIFEVKPSLEGKDVYLRMSQMLKIELEKADGFISGERYESLTEKGKLLSVNVWRDEESLDQWRNNAAHRMNQKVGHEQLFDSYSIKVLSVIRDYSMTDRGQAPDDSNEYIIGK